MWKSLCLALVLGSAANAGLVAIDDPSFESPVLIDGSNITGRDMYCLNNPAPWNVGPPCSGFGNSAWQTADHESDSNGVLNPTIGPVNPSSTSTSPNYSYIPDGDQIAYSHGTTFYQILSTTIEANTTYTLSFWAGQRQDPGKDNLFFENQGYFGELAGGSDFATRTTFLRTVSYKGTHYFGVDSVNATNSPMPDFGEWINIVISYTVGASDPLIGQQLIVSFGAPAVQSNFDMVTIDATSSLPTTTPEPASYAMMAAGLGLLGFWQRRRKSVK